ncbi:MAG: Asp-tRNA(Asn)/Glu-tRNA(Gln) amidotransferase subunit GatB [Hyphomicrobiaceae bacterium]|nr:Asp-tRNA(Asn)/Glu-tRNA(Gln) amidotransferase subunit GatB [Hyphomicrobiaceae bacterium]
MHCRAATIRPDNFIVGATGDWEVVIGLEVHAQVNSCTKLFSGAATAFGGQPNNQVSLIDAGMPGVLPIINEKCIEQAIRTGLGLNARINTYSVFERKNYFYPDLPQGYQISQNRYPIVGEGFVEIYVEGEVHKIGIERLHLEQDAGKSMHDTRNEYSYVDLNRSGIALMEIVSKPELHSAKQAQAYVLKLRNILRYLGTCNGDMERGNLRTDVNVSVRRPGEALGTRCEIKNLNSVRFIGKAIEAESHRQVELLEDGCKILQETRLFDPNSGYTRPMRSKEEAHDYRYFPDPDLLPLELNEAFIEGLAANLPELPDSKFKRFKKEYGLTSYDARVLVAEKRNADYFESVVGGCEGKLAANWVINDVFGRLNREGLDISSSPVSSDQLCSLLKLITEGTISGKIAKEIFETLWSEGGNPADIVSARGLAQVTDTTQIEAIVDEVIKANPMQVQKVDDNPKLLSWFVGQVMKATGGKANPRSVNKIVRKRLALN